MKKKASYFCHIKKIKPCDIIQFQDEILMRNKHDKYEMLNNNAISEKFYNATILQS